MRKSFKYWTRQEIKKNFHLTQSDSIPPLQEWIEVADITLSESEMNYLNHLLKRSLRYVDRWNETELREKFIIKIIELVDFEFEDLNCHSFAERYLSAQVGDYTLYGYADWLVATGSQFPEVPFFFIHQYKPEGAKDIDGRGQLLATMLATNTLHKNTSPIFGTFVVGRLWFFLALEGLSFAETSAFDVLKIDDLYQVVKILKKQKSIILKKLKG